MLSNTDSTDFSLPEEPIPHSSSCYLYCFGGFDADRIVSPSVSRLNVSTKKWHPSTPMSSAKEVPGVAMIGNKVYICGGFGPHGERLNNTEVFDCNTNTWTELTPMPEIRYGCAAAALNGFVYIAGGEVRCDRFDWYSWSSSVIRYNVETDEWQSVKAMQQSRVSHQLVELAGRLYAINGGFGKSVEEYNPTIDEWRMVADTKFNHWAFGATAHNGKLYVCSDKGFEVYSPDSDTWNILTSFNNCIGMTSYVGITLVSLYDKLWAIGGSEYDTGVMSASIFSFDPSTGQWTQLPDMDVPRAYHYSFVVNC